MNRRCGTGRAQKMADGLVMSHPVITKLERFGPLPDDDKAALRDLIGTEREVPAQCDLICEGEDPTVVHLITSGFACRYKRLEDGKRQIVALLIPGDFADPYAFILKVMDHSIATLAPSLVVGVPKHSILDMLERPALARALFMGALADSATLREWIATIGQRNAERRIAHLFCEIHARLRAVGLGSNELVRLPLTQYELGDTVGLSVVHTNRSLRILRQMGLVNFSSGNLSILNISGLQKLCGFTANYLHLT